jgi:hypothetical protein
MQVQFTIMLTLHAMLCTSIPFDQIEQEIDHFHPAL